MPEREDSSERMKQLETIAAYAFVVGLGVYWGYQLAGPIGAAVGAVVAIPAAIATAIVGVLVVFWLFNRVEVNGNGV